MWVEVNGRPCQKVTVVIGFCPYITGDFLNIINRDRLFNEVLNSPSLPLSSEDSSEYTSDRLKSRNSTNLNPEVRNGRQVASKGSKGPCTGRDISTTVGVSFTRSSLILMGPVPNVENVGLESLLQGGGEKVFSRSDSRHV